MRIQAEAVHVLLDAHHDVAVCVALARRLPVDHHLDEIDQAHTCEATLPEELPTVRAGQTDLDQVFFNLLANARDAMPDGGSVKVDATARARDVLVVVEDTGVGIPAKDLPRIQEPFFTTKHRGTGLGLSIVRSILWNAGGNLSVSSREGEGTRVEVVLPLREEG